MRNIKIVVEYDGTAYAGWQVQPGQSTIHGTLTEAIEKKVGLEYKLVGASRTDSGVHAIAMTANFLTTACIPVRGIMNGLNSILPPDIVVKDATEVAPEFDARKDTKGKTYLYRVFNNGHRTALYRERSWSVFHQLDVPLMQEGAELFIGEKDFSSFRATGCGAKHAVREIFSLSIERTDDGFIEFTIKGTAFLRHMVRIIVGTLVTLGKGDLTLDDVAKIIEARDRTAAPLTAPADGLFLKEVEY